jgi:hypothetical protein
VDCVSMSVPLEEKKGPAPNNRLSLWCKRLGLEMEKAQRQPSNNRVNRQPIFNPLRKGASIKLRPSSYQTLPPSPQAMW